MSIRITKHRGACLLELLLGLLLVMGIALFVLTFGWRVYLALRDYIERRNQEIRREIGEDEGEEPVTWHRHQGQNWTIARTA